MICSSRFVELSKSVKSECGLIRYAKMTCMVLVISVLSLCLLGAAALDKIETAYPRCAIVSCALRKYCVGYATSFMSLKLDEINAAHLDLCSLIFIFYASNDMVQVQSSI